MKQCFHSKFTYFHSLRGLKKYESLKGNEFEKNKYNGLIETDVQKSKSNH